MTIWAAASLGGASFLLGLLVGSFLNVVIWRVPRGESVVSPPSHCPACGRPDPPAGQRPGRQLAAAARPVPRLRRADLRRGTPSSSSAPAAVFAVLALRIGLAAELPAFLYLGAVGVALAMIDIDCKRLPERAGPSVLPRSPAPCSAPRRSRTTVATTSCGLRSGMAALYGFYFVLALVYPAGMGFGDVKLAGVLGIYLGWLGWGELVVGAFLGFLFGGVVGLLLMAVRRAGRKSKHPVRSRTCWPARFVAILWGGALADLYLDNVLG